jgi:MYXO-CTERM domain-containing protein
VTAARALAALVVLAAAWPAAAYKQTCDAQGVCLKWPMREITWKLNPSRANTSPSCQPPGAPDPTLDIARASFAAWHDATHAGETGPCTDLTFTYGGTTTSIVAGGDLAEHVILFRQGWCSANPGAVNDPCFDTFTCGEKFDCFDDEGGLGRNTLALTSVSYRANGTIVDADTEIVEWNGASGAITSASTPGVYVTCYGPSLTAPVCGSYGQSDCAYYDLQNTLTHELGHFIGIAHPCGSGSGNPEVGCTREMTDATMYPFEVPGETTKSSLSADDVDAVCTLYPPVKASSGGGCSSGGGPGAAGLLALAAIARLRRRA